MAVEYIENFEKNKEFIYYNNKLNQFRMRKDRNISEICRSATDLNKNAKINVLTHNYKSQISKKRLFKMDL
jgi:hypothetical protein